MLSDRLDKAKEVQAKGAAARPQDQAGAQKWANQTITKMEQVVNQVQNQNQKVSR